MSRFSKAEAESRGWQFFHKTEDEYTDLGNGISRFKAASLRAEKYVSRPGLAANLVSEEAETIGKLLERIHLYEQHLEGLPDYTPAPPEPDVEAPKVTYDPSVQQGENPIVPSE